MATLGLFAPDGMKRYYVWSPAFRRNRTVRPPEGGTPNSELFPKSSSKKCFAGWPPTPGRRFPSVESERGRGARGHPKSAVGAPAATEERVKSEG